MSWEIVRTRASLALLALLSVQVCACEAPPKGQTSGRVPPGTSTAGESSSGLMRTDDLMSASDQIASALARDISEMIDRDFGGKRVTVTFGDIVNKTSKMPTSDFEYLRDRIKSHLMDSRLVRSNVKFVENRARREQLRERELGGSSGGMYEQQAGGRSQPAINEDVFCFLNANVYSVDRPGTRLYYTKFELMRSTDGETVFSRDYEVKYVQ